MYSRLIVRAFLAFVICLLSQALFNVTFAQAPDDIRVSLTGRGHALLIAVSKYDKDTWPELRSVIADIDDLKKGLAPHFATIETLINPKTDNIRNKLREFMTGQWNKPDERLLVYYAGH